MKNLSWFNKIVFFLNLLFAVFLCISFFAPFVSVVTMPFLSAFSLSVPLLVLLNILFCIYWLLRMNKRLFLSALVLILGYFLMGSFIQLRPTSNTTKVTDLKIMSFNVRGFNKSKSISNDSIGDQIVNFVFQESPDIVCIQEFSSIRHNRLKNKYKYIFIVPDFDSRKARQAIYSIYPIINSGEVPFNDTNNLASFADVLYKKDTIRVYNLHLESLKVTPKINAISNENSTKLYERVTKSFKKQQEQATIVKNHIAELPYKTIIVGDFNNNQYSNVYRIIKGDLQDTFNKKGTGYGRTYNYKYYPVRIDFILADERFEVTVHKNYDIVLSDHFPVMAGLKVRSNK